MAKVSRSDKLMSGVERLLANLVHAASVGDVTNPDGMVVIQGPSFGEKLKVAATATSFLACKAKITPDEPEGPSAFEEVLDELRGKTGRNADPPKKLPGRKRREPSQAAAERPPAPLRDPLAPPGADPFTINGHVYGNGHADPDGGAIQ
jgi:hypothetical protein